MMRLGACVGTVTPELANLNLDWAFGVYANAMADEFKNQPFEFVPLTFENEPNVEWTKFVTWSNYGGYWLIGNEPHTAWDNNRPVADVAQVFMRQMEYIRGFDPSAKFIVTCSTQGQVPYNRHSDQNFIGGVWNTFTPKFRRWTRGFHMHIYPRWISDDDNIRWDYRYFTRYVRGLRRWMDEQQILAREIWISEFGFEREFAGDARGVNYVRDVLNSRYLGWYVDRLAFYVATERDGSGGSNGYLPLLDANGNLTDLGRVWKRTK
jgi:hypothetical protein